MQNPHLALKAIEHLTGSDFGLDMEWLLTEHREPKTPVDPRLLRAAQMITDIYMLAHAEGQCGGHPEWEKKKYKIIKAYKNE